MRNQNPVNEKKYLTQYIGKDERFHYFYNIPLYYYEESNNSNNSVVNYSEIKVAENLRLKDIIKPGIRFPAEKLAFSSTSIKILLTNPNLKNNIKNYGFYLITKKGDNADYFSSGQNILLTDNYLVQGPRLIIAEYDTERFLNSKPSRDKNNNYTFEELITSQIDSNRKHNNTVKKPIASSNLKQPFGIPLSTDKDKVPNSFEFKAYENILLDAIKNNAIYNPGVSPLSGPPISQNLKSYNIENLKGKKPFIIPIPLKYEEEEVLNAESYTRIGYTTLLIPPQAINVVRENSNNSNEVLRSTGTIKTMDYNNRITIDISFVVSGHEMINKVLIPLLNQFRRTPFLPIQNLLLNSQWNIYDIVIRDISVSTVDNTPNVLAINIVAEPFAWQHYLPHDTSFSSTFCWPLFKLWCESRSRCIPLTDKFNGSIEFLIPLETKLEEKSKELNSLNSEELNKVREGIPINLTGTVVDQDIDNIAVAVSNLGTKINDITSLSEEVYRFPSNVGNYTIIAIRNPKTILVLLNEKDVFNLKNSGPKEAIKKIGNKWELEISNIETSEKTQTDIENITQDLLANEVSNERVYIFAVPDNSNAWNKLKLLVNKTGIGNNKILSQDFESISLRQESAITNIAMQMSNILSVHQTYSFEIPLHQYIAGNDSIITLQGILSSQEEVQILRSIVDKVQNLSKKYRANSFEVPYAGFLKIRNEIVNSLGLESFIPIKLTINTVNGFPDIFNFQLDLIEFNPSQRNMEEFEQQEKDLISFLKEGSLKAIFTEDILPQDVNIINSNEIKNLFKEGLNENVEAKVWRSKLLFMKLRTIDLYPDMNLPSKKELDYWIALLRYFATDLNNAKNITIKEQQQYIYNALSCIDLTKENINKILSMSESNDPLGYCDPDFYIKSKVSGSKYVEEMLDRISKSTDNVSPDGSVKLYDIFGGAKVLSPGKALDGKEMDNTITSKEQKEFTKYQIEKLSGVASNIAQQKEGLLASQQFIPQGPILNSNPKALSGITSFNMYPNDLKLSGGLKKHSVDKIDPRILTWIHQAINHFNLKGNRGPALDIGLIIGIIARESDFNPSEGSSNKYKGLLQLDPQDARDRNQIEAAGLKWPGDYSVLDPKTNIFLGTGRIYNNLNEFGSYYLALAGHNQGEEDVRRFLKGEKQIYPSVDLYAKEVLEIASYYNQKVGNKPLNSSLNPSIKDYDVVAFVESPLAGVYKAYKTTKINTKKYVVRLYDGLPEISKPIKVSFSLNVGFEVTKIEAPGGRESSFQCFIEDPNAIDGASSTRIIGPQAVDQGQRKLLEQKIPELKNETRRFFINNLDPLPGGVNSPRPDDDPKLPYKEMFEDLIKKSDSDYSSMLKAFPTYFVQVIDGGKWLGVERLWDHFYGGFGINSIEVVQSRKEPVDVATIVFSNLYGKLTALAADISRQKGLDTRLQWSMESFVEGVKQFLSGRAGQDLERRWSTFINTMLMKPGARLHIRMGYGNDAYKLPVKFNGTISEVPIADKYTQVVAIGDGHELLNQFPDDEAHQVFDTNIDQSKPYWQNTGWLNRPKEPAFIVSELFGPTSDIKATLTQGRWKSDNPYGINSFGSIDYSNIGSYGLGEVAVNIYKSDGEPEIYSSAWQNWVVLTGVLAHLNGATLMGVQIEDASPWKVIETCRKGIPDFITTVRPFGYRSTLFFGKPWWDYYYQYKFMKGYPGEIRGLPENPSTKEQNNALDNLLGPIVGDQVSTVVKKPANPNFDYRDSMDKKLLSQYHLISSYHNLIMSNIVADESNVYTNCQCKYVWGGVTVAEHKDSDLMKADSDIFPETQKTQIIKSGILSGPLHGGQALMPWTVPTAANTFSVQTIRDSVADMYQGHNMILGDPWIYTYDFAYLQDTENYLSGLYQVKEVINHFSVENGYITMVSPDCCVAAAGNWQPSMWLTASKALTTLANYRIWNYVTNRILENYTEQAIKTKIISQVVLKNKNKLKTVLELANDPKALTSATQTLDEYSKFLKTIKNLKIFDLDANGNIIISKAFSNLKGVELAAFEELMLERLRYLGPQVEEIIKSNLILSRLGERIGSVISNSQNGKESYELLGLINKLKQSAEVQIIKSASTKSLESVVPEVALKLSSQTAKGLSSLSKLGGILFTLITPSIGDIIGRYNASRQCVTIYPLTCNGLEFSAGINGHLGAVIGDPLSLSDQFFASMFSESYASRNFGFLGSLVPILINIVLPGTDSGWNPQSNIDEKDVKKRLQTPGISIKSFNDYVDDILLSSTGVSQFKEERLSNQKIIGELSTNFTKIPSQFGTSPYTNIKYTGRVDKERQPTTRTALLADIQMAAQNLGYKIEISSAWRVPGDSGSADHSRHFSSRAVDIFRINGASLTSNSDVFTNYGNRLFKALKKLGYELKGNGSGLESETSKAVLWQVKGHYDHLHVSVK